MQDPMRALPKELWSFCIKLAIDGRLNGPLEFLMVSAHWRGLLLDTPFLWTQIYIQNGEDEIARISTFLHLSKQSPLHVDVMTVLPTLDSLRLVAEHISRVITISLRPGPSDDVTALHARQWKIAASYVLATLSNGMQLCDVQSPFCFGINLRDDDQLYRHVILLQFTVAARAASKDELNHTWEERIAKATPAPEDQNYSATAASIYLIDDLASYSRFYDVIRTTIRSFVKLLEWKENRVRLETLRLIDKWGNHVEFHEAIATMIPTLIKLLENEEYYDIQRETVKVIGQLANHVEIREEIATTIPTLIGLLEDMVYQVRRETIEVIGPVANHVEIREAIAATIPSLIKPFGYGVRWKTVELIGELADHVEFREAIAAMIPSLINLLKYENECVRREAVELIRRLANHVEFRDALATAIPVLVKLLEDSHFQVQRGAGKIVGDMISSGMFQRSLFALTSRKLDQREW